MQARRNFLLKYIFCSLFFAALSSTASPAPMALPFSDLSIRVDAHLDDEIWQHAKTIELLYETYPGENIPPSVKTEALLVENGEYLLVAFRAYDPDPASIRAFLRDRDSAYNDDYIGIVVDTFNDEKRAFEFFVNPLGAQIDLIQDDVANTEDDAWNAAWLAEARITEQGYLVEMAIPLNILRFHAGLKQQVWGLDLVRFRPRSERIRIANNPQNRDISCYLCQLSTLQGFTDAVPSTNLEVVPSFVTTQSSQRNIDAGAPWQDHNASDMGLDVRWGVTHSSTVNLTVNPDFSQVEADSAQLDVNSTFSLFFPEKRPFFLDSADYFETFVDVVHTRNIAAPDVGLKYTAKTGEHTAGLIVANDEKTTFIVPSSEGSSLESFEQKSQNAIMRYRYDQGNNSTVGVVSTIKQSEDYQNILVGVDGKYRFSGSDTFRYQVITSSTENPDALMINEDGGPGLKKQQEDHALNLRYDHNSRNWFAYAEHRKFGEDFRADLGFISQVDYDLQMAGLGRVWHGSSETWWTRIQLNAGGTINHRSDEQLLEKKVEAYYGINGPLQSYLEVGAFNRHQFYEGTLHKLNLNSFYGELKPRAGLLMGTRVRVGDAIDFVNNQRGDEVAVEPWLDWNATRNIFVKLNMNYLKFTLQDQTLFTAHTNNIRFTYQFSNKSFLRFSTQQTNIERNLSLYDPEQALDRRSRYISNQLLYSYKLTPQTVFFLGYANGGYRDDDVTEFKENNKTAFLKLSYAWLPN